MELTPLQQTAMLQVGSPSSQTITVSIEAIEELIELGLLYRRPEGNLEFTSAGQEVYAELAGEA